MSELIEALKLLDPKDDKCWTEDGLPLIEAVSSLVKRDVTRDEITKVAPLFTREKPSLEVEPVKPPEPAPTPEEKSDVDADLLAAQEEVEAAEAKVVKAKKALEDARANYDRIYDLKLQINPPKHASEIIKEMQQRNFEHALARAGQPVPQPTMAPIDAARQLPKVKQGPMPKTPAKKEK